MAPPQTLLIPHEDFEGARFTHVGRFGDGKQFLGLLTYASQYVPKFYYTEEIAPDGQSIWRQKSNCFAVLHRFDTLGTHLGTDVQRVGGTADSNERDWATLEKMIAKLGKIEFCEIRVKPFHVEIEKIVHALIYECSEEDGEEQEWVTLEPADIMFHPPWDSGEYST